MEFSIHFHFHFHLPLVLFSYFDRLVCSWSKSLLRLFCFSLSQTAFMLASWSSSALYSSGPVPGTSTTGWENVTAWLFLLPASSTAALGVGLLFFLLSGAALLEEYSKHLVGSQLNLKQWCVGEGGVTSPRTSLAGACPARGRRRCPSCCWCRWGWWRPPARPPGGRPASWPPGSCWAPAGSCCSPPGPPHRPHFSPSGWTWTAASSRSWSPRCPSGTKSRSGGCIYRTAAHFLCSSHDRYNWLLWVMRAAQYTRQHQPSRTTSAWRADPWCRGPPRGSWCPPPALPCWRPCTGRLPWRRLWRHWSAARWSRWSWSYHRTAVWWAGWSWWLVGQPCSTGSYWAGPRRSCRRDSRCHR